MLKALVKIEHPIGSRALLKLAETALSSPDNWQEKWMVRQYPREVAAIKKAAMAGVCTTADQLLKFAELKAATSEQTYELPSNFSAPL